jgi:hypothetical protein
MLSSFAIIDPPKDYLSVKGPLNFNNTEFELAWSSNPNEVLYIQEYLPIGESLEMFNQMLTIQLFRNNITVSEAVDGLVKQLEERKKTDSTCRYKLIESPDKKEFIIDFIMGESENDTMTLVEFNIFHYREVDLEKKTKGVATYAYAQRSYGADITEFLNSLKDKRVVLLNEMIGANKPQIKLIKQ